MSASDAFRTLTVVSPMQEGDEMKNQDRAYWFEPGAVAAVCDGVTTSPRSDEAAELITRYSPVLFQGPLEERLRVMCDLLVAKRMEAMRQDLRIPDSIPESMRDMLSQVGRESMSRAFQTTFVAACLTAGHEETLVDVVACGDSVFLAFQADGKLLVSSAEADKSPTDDEHTDTEDKSAQKVRIGPGDDLLVKVQSQDTCDKAHSQDPDDTQPDRWLVCRLLDLTRKAERPPVATAGMLVNKNEQLLVPAYLAGQSRDSEFSAYRVVPFSRVIRLAGDEATPTDAPYFDQRGNVTCVLPDHFYTGAWHRFQDRFPGDAQFVLATDGFTSAFHKPGELWQWLRQHEHLLESPEKQGALLRRLHTRLRRMASDDDISFIWIRPACAKPVIQKD